MTGKMKSAKGERHGRLTVIKDYMKEISNGRKAHYALCRCDCGETIEVLLASLRNGNTTSCGCAKVMDLSGEQFGKLTVIGKYPERIDGRFMWKCRCECGNVVYAFTKDLRYGSKAHCGCGFKPDPQKMLADRVEGTRRGSLTRGTRSDNTSGRKGVSWNGRRHQYEAYIATSKKSKKHIGWFDTFEDAVKARVNAEKIYYEPILETTISGIREKDGEYIAEINIKGKTHRIGKFKTREEAEAARRKAEKLL